MIEVEKAFKETTILLFGTDLSHLEQYEKWLHTNTPGGRFIKNQHSKIFLPNFSMFQFVPEKIAAGLEVTNRYSKKKLDLKKIEFVAIGKEFSKNYPIICNVVEGRNLDDVDCTWYLNCQHVYKNACSFHARYCAYNIWCSFTDHVFGSYRTMNSSFCINCYFSTELTRCFEMDSCRSCYDSMFCHNCENMKDCLFCFNTKSLQYAVGNVEIGKEKYEYIKKIVVDYIVKELKEKKKLRYNIYNMGSNIIR